MRKLLEMGAAVIGLALFSTAAFFLWLGAAQVFVGKAGLYVLVLSAIVTFVFVVFRQLPDKRAATLQTILSDEAGVTHSVEADALVVECVRKMTDNKIGALMVMDGGKLVGTL